MGRSANRDKEPLALAAAATAVAGPPLLALWTICAAGNPSVLTMASGGLLTLVVATADALIVARRRYPVLLAALAAHAALALFWSEFRPSPLPPPPPLAAQLPAAFPPKGVAAYRLPAGVTHRSAAFAYQGGSIFDRRDFSMTAVLVTHPRGDLLIDTGLGREIDAQIRLMPLGFRAMTSYEKDLPAAERLDAGGYDHKSLRGIILTHAHWDHVSGVPDLPGVPVLVTAEERRFIDDGGWIMAPARSVAARYEVYGFEGGPFLGFPKSHDVYGDGAVVIVPAPGHTPGSVIIFVALSDGSRRAFVGDLVWQREGITEREERAWFLRDTAEADPAAVRENLLRMAAIAARFPQITLAPAHDTRGFADLPIWNGRRARQGVTGTTKKWRTAMTDVLRRQRPAGGDNRVLAAPHIVPDREDSGRVAIDADVIANEPAVADE